MRKAQVMPGDISAVRERIQRIVGDDSVPPVLSRLVREDCALQALAEMHLTDQQLIKILISCVEADCNARTFTRRLEHENLIGSRLDTLKFSIGEIIEFLNQACAPPDDPLSGYVCVDDEDKRRYSQSLYEIERLIDARAKIAKQTPTRIGATRKNEGTVAAENAGIGWLATAIRRGTGKAFTDQACVIAETVFCIDEVTPDRLRGAYRNFSDHDWRDIN